MNPTNSDKGGDAEAQSPCPPFLRPLLRHRVLVSVAILFAVAVALGGWSPGFPLIYTVVRSVGLWLLNGFFLGTFFSVAAHWLNRQPWMPSSLVALGAGGAVAMLGYVAFWIWFAHPAAGLVFSTVMLGVGVRLFLRQRGSFDARDREWIAVVAVMVFVALLHLGILHEFGARQGFLYLAYNRFLDYGALGQDNLIPHEFNVQLSRGDCRVVFIDWLYSDRPPLQTGWQSLTWPLYALLKLNDMFVTGLAGMWFQLLWVPAVYALFQWTGMRMRSSLAWCGVLALSGFFLLNTVFTWPKLGAAAFAIGAFVLWAQPRSPHTRRQILAGAVLVSLAWLSHGGVAFSFLPLAPWLAWRALRGEFREWALAAAIFALFALPWTAFQKFYAPPGNRLLKWHLGGQIEVDPRGVWETIRSGYAKLSWEEIARIKRDNLAMHLDGHWGLLGDFSESRAHDRREKEFWYAGAALAWWKAAPFLLLLSLASPAARRRLAENWWRIAVLALWVAATFVVWCLMIFLPGTAHVLVGSYAKMAVLFVVFSALAECAGRWAIFAVAIPQAVSLLTTWGVRFVSAKGPVSVNGPFNPPALLLMALGGAGIAWLMVRTLSEEKEGAAAALN